MSGNSLYTDLSLYLSFSLSVFSLCLFLSVSLSHLPLLRFFLDSPYQAPCVLFAHSLSSPPLLPSLALAIFMAHTQIYSEREKERRRDAQTAKAATQTTHWCRQPPSGRDIYEHIPLPLPLPPLSPSPPTTVHYFALLFLILCLVAMRKNVVAHDVSNAEGGGPGGEGEAKQQF